MKRTISKHSKCRDQSSPPTRDESSWWVSRISSRLCHLQRVGKRSRISRLFSRVIWPIRAAKWLVAKHDTDTRAPTTNLSLHDMAISPALQGRLCEMTAPVLRGIDRAYGVLYEGRRARGGSAFHSQSGEPPRPKIHPRARYENRGAQVKRLR